jgi:hypothetical protein
MIKQTPWGPARHSNHLAAGIIYYSAETYGGLHLSKTRVLELPQPVADAVANKVTSKGELWLDHATEWAYAAVAFPTIFKPHQVAEAKQTLCDYFPRDYELIYDVKLKPGQSLKLDEDVFFDENKDRLISTSAVTSIYGHIPAGMVGVYARKGGLRNADGADESYWLVSEAEYNDAPFGLVIDEARHQLMHIKVGEFWQRPTFS